jgi:4-carboxymuconolactone decarboxylase
MTSRLSPLPADQWDEQVCDAVAVLLPRERTNPRDAGNILGTLVHNPALTKAYLQFNKYVLVDSTLSARVREIAILKTALLRDCPYLWSHHVPIAQRAGLSVEEISAVERGEAADDFDQLVLNAVDELHTDAKIADGTWAALGDHLDDQQRMDLIFAVGCYALLATAVNTLGIEEEQPVP